MSLGTTYWGGQGSKPITDVDRNDFGREEDLNSLTTWKSSVHCYGSGQISDIASTWRWSMTMCWGAQESILA